MNPALLLTWWREILIALLVLAIGVQTFRLHGAQHARDMLALEKKEREKRDAMRALHNLKNKERTDEEYAAARGRAGSVVVRLDGPGIRAPQVKAPGGDEPAICFERGRLVEALAGWVERDGARLAELLRGVAERSTDDARAGEEVAAAYRACRAYTLSLE